MYVYVCICVCVHIHMNSLMVADTLTFPKYPLEKIFFIFLVHSFDINQTSETQLENSLLNVSKVID